VSLVNNQQNSVQFVDILIQTNIVGSWNGASSYQLWYVHNDGTPSFSDFKAFGGWNKPYAKQYRGNTSMCNTSVHLDWLPGNSVKIN
jgi:hypothetical protein